MSRRSFWLGVLVGLVVMGVVVACLAGLVMLRSRGMLGPALGLRARSFGWVYRGGRLAPVLPVRGLGAFVCLPAMLFVVGGIALIAVLAGHWFGRHGREHYHHAGQKPAESATQEVQEVKQAVAEPPAESAHPATQG